MAVCNRSLMRLLVVWLVNAVIRPLLVLLTLPVTVLTLGLFILVINGLLFWAVGTSAKPSSATCARSTDQNTPIR